MKNNLDVTNHTYGKSKNRNTLSRSTAAIVSTLLLSSLLLSGCIDKEAAAAPKHITKENKENVKVEKKKTVVVSKKHLEKWIAAHDGRSIHAAMEASFQKKVSQNDVQKLLAAFWTKGEQPRYVGQRFSPDGIIAESWTNKDKSKLILAEFENGKISYLLLLTPPKFPETDSYQTKTTFQLPFDGEWFVGWGGHNVIENYHYAYETQRYALDLVVTKKGKSFKGSGKNNEDYYAFGKKVLSPADGTVVEIVTDIPDNVPGEMNPEQTAGNYVIIDHGNNEYSLLAHFKQHSIKVKKGDKIKTGDYLGDCGNSGNSSEAHIHYQVSDKPSFEHGRSLPPRYEKGIFPVQGQTLKGQSSTNK
ncbi:M23 family metallopeptidase [Paenibacillus sp. SC116]|uniref:M23 family metallopeptidase n=1 Tax=Paenibacillus sp. SC116 TaxID=2968986 RepID=UPI00215B1C0F|nr:M23 family metallopeptidase [Paenibacillus sp. SC116]MCR8845834.1 M23 family metallopeptidase [Paenibacillus sp. SC116]